MKKSLLLYVTFIVTLSITINVNAQFEYEPSTQNPYGLVNPDAPSELSDFDPLIGLSECTSEIRNPDGSWNEPSSMVWKWKYIMNGLAVQDEVLREDFPNAGSIRQFNADSAAWYVHYYSSNSPIPTLPSWKGGKQDNGDIILYRAQQAPNGMDGFYKINFLDITEKSFYWQGEWVNPDESIIYPTWKIDCKKIES